MFPILETSATASRGSTGNNLIPYLSGEGY